MIFRFRYFSAILVLLGVLTFAVGTGCSDETGTDTLDAGQADDVVDDDVQAPEDATDTESDDNDDEEDAFSCEPGEVVGCVEGELRAYEQCNDDGTALEQTYCEGMEICKEGECIEAECLPGMSQCSSPTVREACEVGEDGEPEYVEQPPCDDNMECVQGECIDRCEQAEESASYIGCEYWAVEKENHLVHSNISTLEGERPPFAVVLANTESELSAEVTVHGPNGEIAESIGERQVAPSMSFMGGGEPVTVYSETVDSDGERIGDPHDGPIDGIELPPDTTLTLILPNQDIPFAESTVTSTAYRVESTQPVVAYQFNPLCCNYNYTNDASLLMPTTSLTNRYMMVGHAVFEFSTAEPYGPTLTVVGTEPDTNVQIHLPESLAPSGNYDQQIYTPRAGDGIEGPDASGLMEVTLDEHEVFNLSAGGTNPPADLSGTRVQADAEVAAFGGHTCTYVPTSSPACDHLEVQLHPLETWGDTFVAAPHKLRDASNADDPNSLEGTYWKFVAREDDTVIDVGISVAEGDVLSTSSPSVPHCGDPEFGDEQANGIIELDEGETCEFGTREPFRAVGNSPFSIAGFMSSQDTVASFSSWGDHDGDPAKHLPPPQHQYRDAYTFLTPPTYHVSYITVVIPTEHNLMLDGEEIDPTDYDHHVLEDDGLVVAHIEVEPGPHFVEADIGFGLVVYGYDDYVSYAYTGGMNLERKYDF